MSSRRLEGVFSVTIFRLPRRLQDVLREVLKTCSRRLQDVLEDVELLRWRRAEDVFKTNKCLLGTFQFFYEDTWYIATVFNVNILKELLIAIQTVEYISIVDKIQNTFIIIKCLYWTKKLVFFILFTVIVNSQ